jgi:hypothetical protein
MNLQTKAALLVSGLVLVVAPAVALGAKPTAPGNASTPAASQYPKGHAYGFFCKAESKLHVAGTPGTPFSKCVTAMAKLANGSTKSAKAACASLSKKHVSGTQGTPFSACVSAGTQLLATTTPSP